MPYQQTYRQAQKKQLMAYALMGKAMTPAQRPQGRIAANTGLADGLNTLAMALAARRAGKQADALGAQGDEERRQAQVAALSGMANPPNLVETQAAQNPYMRAQAAMEAEVDPNIVDAYMQQKTGTGKSPFGVINPSDFTPESLRKFNSTGDYGDLEPVEKNLFGRYNPRDYTPESLAKFNESGNPADLVRVAPYQIKDNPAGGADVFDPISGTLKEPARTAEEGTQMAADKARATAQASAEGDAMGKAWGAYMAKAASAQGVQEILDMAEPIIDVATGSATGAIRDRVASWFGVSTDGAQGIAQLMPLQAALMMAMPRMEGPQSNYDVQLYREAAGQIGDPNVPDKTKKAALVLIRQMHEKYAERGANGLPNIVPNGQARPLPAESRTMPQNAISDWESLK